MAFDFLGTFNRSQFERFLTFARSQLPLIEDRILHLQNEISRVGVVVFQIDAGVPQGYAGEPETSYMGKLLAAYEVMGGQALYDLRLRVRSDPVYLIRGDEVTDPQYTSGGEPIGGRGLSDGPTAVLMQIAKSWVSDTVRARFERLERKIRRAMDYSDQLQKEITLLQTIQLAADARGSLEFIANQIQEYLADNNYDAIYDDQESGQPDPYGLLAYALRAGYSIPLEGADPNADVARQVVVVQKQRGGVVVPGQGSGGSTA